MTTNIVFVVLFLCFIPWILEINSASIDSKETDEEAKCVDTHPDCGSTFKNLCTKKEYRPFALVSCRKHCDLCKECKFPPQAPRNGDVKIINDFSTLVYQCDKGYYLSNGDIERTCDKDGKWSGTQPTCSPVIGNKCNNTVKAACEKIAYAGCADSCKCLAGYRQVGGISCEEVYNSSCTGPEDCSDLAHSTCRKENESKHDNVTSTPSHRNQCLCEENYYYNSTSHLCHKYCGDPGEPTNGTSDKSNGSEYRWEYLALATYNCDVGFDLVGNRTVVCNADGNWSPGQPSCNIKDCGNLPNVSSSNGWEDVTNNSNDTVYLSTATAQCVKGYRIKGNNSNDITSVTISCQSSGNWSQLPQCERKDCGNLPNVSSSNGLQDVTNNSKDTVYLSTATANCLKGYRIKGNHSNEVVSSKITCQSSGNWSQLPHCEMKDCGKPKSPPNGNITSDPEKKLYNDSVTYICNPGYYTTDQTNGTCTSSGKWSTPPICNDIDECALYTADCHRRANCHNTNGSYTCDCQNGFKDISVGGRHGLNCEDIDECRNNSINFCNKNGSQCINYPGGFLCSCFDGWTGGNCTTDIDECNETTACGPNATCKNTLGSYICTCNKGYPQGDPHIHCYEKVIIDLETKVEAFRGDDQQINSKPIQYRFPYFGVKYNSYRPNMNGFLTLGYKPVYEDYGPETSGEWKNYSRGLTVIAPFWTNLDSTGLTGGLYVHFFENYDHYGKNDSKHRDLTYLGEIFKNYSKLSDSTPRVALVATWLNVTQSSYIQPTRLVKTQNASMQVILISDGIHSYVMFNYDHELWSLKMENNIPSSAGYSLRDKTGYIIATSKNISQLNTGTNVSPALSGRWIYDVSSNDANINSVLRNESDCLEFSQNGKIRDWITDQRAKSYPCPCSEQQIQLDYSYHTVPAMYVPSPSTICYEAWFFNNDGVKQTCCYSYGALKKENTGGGFATFENDQFDTVQYFYKCCGENTDRHLCHLFYEMNPPDDCSRFQPADEPIES